jgi:uncharacterized cupin superfamily protein
MSALPAQQRAIEYSDLKPCVPYFGEAVGPAPWQGVAVLHSIPEKGIVAGIWECRPGTLKLDIKADEFCHVIKGHWILTSDDGVVLEIRAGDSFFFPKGWQGHCEIRETVRKVFTTIKAVG